MIKIYIKLVVILIASLLVSIIITENGEPFLTKLPDLMGFILAGVLSSLAIIFGLLSKEDLIEIHKKSLLTNKDLFGNFIRNTKQDIMIIFSSYIISIILMLFNNSNVYNNILKLFNYNIFLYLGISILILSLFSVYDVIESLFTLNIVRYEIAKNSINKESK